MSLLLSGEQLPPTFREVVCYDQDKAMSSGCWRTDGSNHIHSSHLKWPWEGCWMKMSRCLMDKVTVDLTRMTSLSIGDGVRDHLRPIIPKSFEPVSELWSGLVSSAHTIMSFFECLLCFFVWKTSEQDSIIRSAIQCLHDCIVIESRGFSSDGGCLLRVVRQ